MAHTTNFHIHCGNLSDLPFSQIKKIKMPNPSVYFLPWGAWLWQTCGLHTAQRCLTERATECQNAGYARNFSERLSSLAKVHLLRGRIFFAQKVLLNSVLRLANLRGRMSQKGFLFLIHTAVTWTGNSPLENNVGQWYVCGEIPPWKDVSCLFPYVLTQPMVPSQVHLGFSLYLLILSSPCTASEKPEDRSQIQIPMNVLFPAAFQILWYEIVLLP